MRALISCILIGLMPLLAFAGGPQTGVDAKPVADSQPPAPASAISQTASQGNAAQTGVLYATGSVFLNGAQLSNSMPVMTGDVVETKDVSVAHIEMSGSTDMVQSNAIVRFRDGGLALDRGKVTVATGKSQSVFARDFQITPVSSEWTQFEVLRSSGTIHVSAIKNSVEIKCGVEAPTVVNEGHELTRLDAHNCGMDDKTGSSGAPPTASGPVLSSAWAEGAGLVTAGALLGWTFTHIGDDAVSPDSPDKP
jgi:ferric-dicitrate binding protein FerR (iron transport regulator)